MESRGKIKSIQGLRALMFLIIFGFHSDLFLDQYSVFNKFLIGGQC